MSVSLGLATETEGRRASPPRLLEGGRYLGTPHIARLCLTYIGGHAAPRLPLSCSPSPRWPLIHLKPSPFFVSHSWGALQFLPVYPLSAKQLDARYVQGIIQLLTMSAAVRRRSSPATTHHRTPPGRARK